MRDLRHCWISLHETFNYGNRLIEHCLRQLLQLESQEVCINAYPALSEAQMEELNSCDYVVWPGGTLIQRKEHPGMEQIQHARPPAFCFGAAFFTRLPFPHPQYCRRLERPVGARDSFTDRRLRMYGIPSALIGCPTMFAGDQMEWRSPSDGPVVFCFGRYNLGVQLKIFDQIRQEAPVRVVIQEERQRKHCPPGTDVVEYNDIEGVIEAYATASVVVTGRLHAALPAVVSGTPVVFSQLVHDSRITLLKDIGLEIHNPYSTRVLPLTRELRSGSVTLPTYIFDRIAALKARYLAFVDDFRHRVAQLR
jgi:hypothetical protein